MMIKVAYVNILIGSGQSCYGVPTVQSQPESSWQLRWWKYLKMLAREESNLSLLPCCV